MPTPARIALLSGVLFSLLPAASDGAETASPTPAAASTIDFRYAPPWWQTSICLPDDWQKTLVGKEGQMLYDFRGKFNGFKTRIGTGYGQGSEWVRQELASPRVPIVRTFKRQGPVEIVEEAFAVAPVLPPVSSDTFVSVERLDEGRQGLLNWAAPKVKCDPAFRHIAVGFNKTIHYRFRAEKGKKYTVVFGLCEGHWTEPAKRDLDLQIEGKTRKTVDMVGEHGQNVPAMFPFEATDENGDGWIDATVAARRGTPDQNTILNVLWIFEGDPPPMEELLAGKSSRPALAHVDCGVTPADQGPARNDVVIVRMKNAGGQEVRLTPTMVVESEFGLSPDVSKGRVAIGEGTTLVVPVPFEIGEQADGKLVLRLPEAVIPAGAEKAFTLGIARGTDARLVPGDVAEAVKLRRRAEDYWRDLDLPYDHLRVPDPGVQALVDSSIRNIYQAREIKNGLPAFQVGPTCYRGLWVVDGSFLLEAVTFLGRTDEARAGIQYLLSFQRPDGAVMIIDGHLKETGIALWAVTRHARLTNDPTWLFSVWPKVERAMDAIQKMRAETWSDPKAPEYNLLPKGFSDGGLGGKYPEYTNIYWTLAGMRSAVEAAKWLGNMQEAAEWQHRYDDFYKAFRQAAQRDMKTDPHGNRYLPIRMVDDQNVAPQKAQWAFLHAIFPGKVFAPDDPLVKGNLAMLEAVECEGLVFGTGWLNEGIWNYFGSFYAHGLLWTGRRQKAAQVLYAFGNHASPLLCWREEHMPQGKGDQICGDMPHNWASAEFIRLVRHLLVLERGDELHLLEGMSPAWAKPGAVTEVRDVLTIFGPMSFKLTVSQDGTAATLHLEPPRRTVPQKIVLHLDGWTKNGGTIDLPITGTPEINIPIR